jgi:hypothetical protein
MFLVLRVAVFFLFTFSGYLIGVKYNYAIYGALIGGFLGLISISTELI